MKYKAYAFGTVTVEMSRRGTSRYCFRCGAKGERFSCQGGKQVKMRGGELLLPGVRL